MIFQPIPDSTDAVAKTVVDCAYHVHKALGPGLLEAVYEVCLCHELHKRGISFERQVARPVLYDGLRLDAGLRLDLLVSSCVIVELKAVEHILPIHKAQLLTYLKLCDIRLGLLINFNVSLIKNGIERIIL